MPQREVKIDLVVSLESPTSERFWGFVRKNHVTPDAVINSAVEDYLDRYEASIKREQGPSVTERIDALERGIQDLKRSMGR